MKTVLFKFKKYPICISAFWAVKVCTSTILYHSNEEFLTGHLGHFLLKFFFHICTQGGQGHVLGPLLVNFETCQFMLIWVIWVLLRKKTLRKSLMKDWLLLPFSFGLRIAKIYLRVCPHRASAAASPLEYTVMLENWFPSVTMYFNGDAAAAADAAARYGQTFTAWVILIGQMTHLRGAVSCWMSEYHFCGILSLAPDYSNCTGGNSDILFCHWQCSLCRTREARVDSSLNKEWNFVLVTPPLV